MVGFNRIHTIRRFNVGVTAFISMCSGGDVDTAMLIAPKLMPMVSGPARLHIKCNNIK